MSDIPPEMYDNEGAMGGMYDDEGVRAPIMPKSEVLVEEPYLRPARMRPPRGEVNVFDMLRDYRHETLLARGKRLRFKMRVGINQFHYRRG